MSFGFIAYDASGLEPTFKATGRSFRVIWTSEVPAGSSGSQQLPGFNQINAVAYSVRTGANNVTHSCPIATMGNGVVTWETNPLTPAAFRSPGVVVVVGFA